MSLYKHFPEPDFLMHYGVKGMKWKHHKVKSKPTTQLQTPTPKNFEEYFNSLSSDEKQELVDQYITDGAYTRDWTLPEEFTTKDASRALGTTRNLYLKHPDIMKVKVSDLPDGMLTGWHMDGKEIRPGSDRTIKEMDRVITDYWLKSQKGKRSSTKRPR